MSHKWLWTSLALVFAAPALAQDPAVDNKDEQRLRDLENRIRQLESHGDAGPTTDPAAARDAGTRLTSNTFNPAMSLILDGRYAGFTHNPSTYALPGFATAAETGPGDEGLRLGESELVFSANIDDKFYGALAAALTPENEVEIEEAFFETLTLGHGLTVRGGRFFSGIGYLNSVHAHAWDFADQPLPYRAMLGKQYGDDGVQVRWVAPTDLFLELGGELFRGEAYPAGGSARAGKGAYTAFARVGGDVGVSHAWRVGLSHLSLEARNRETGNVATPDLFSGDSVLTILDFVWKWAPDGNARERNFKFQSEIFRRDEDGTFDPASSGTAIPYRGEQRGWYAQGLYQFMPRWRLALRYGEAKADPVDTALAGGVLDSQGHTPKAVSAMVDFSNTEFSRLRVQVNRDDARANATDTQWYLQYTMSLGPHGAHAF